jgi:hypothetical protein
MARSDDEEGTWSAECEAVEVADGVVYMTMRSRHGRKCRAFSWSRDGGESWSERETCRPTLMRRKS